MRRAIEDHQWQEFKAKINASTIGRPAEEVTWFKLFEGRSLKQITHNSNAGRYYQDPQ